MTVDVDKIESHNKDAVGHSAPRPRLHLSKLIWPTELCKLCKNANMRVYPFPSGERRRQREHESHVPGVVDQPTMSHSEHLQLDSDLEDQVVQLYGAHIAEARSSPLLHEHAVLKATPSLGDFHSIQDLAWPQGFEQTSLISSNNANTVWSETSTLQGPESPLQDTRTSLLCSQQDTSCRKTSGEISLKIGGSGQRRLSTCACNADHGLSSAYTFEHTKGLEKFCRNCALKQSRQRRRREEGISTVITCNSCVSGMLQ
jgi:hypothetical protein